MNNMASSTSGTVGSYLTREKMECIQILVNTITSMEKVGWVRRRIKSWVNFVKYTEGKVGILCGRSPMGSARGGYKD